MILYICLDENLVCMLKKQITSLVITMDGDKLEKTQQDLTTPCLYVSSICSRISVN